MSEEKETADPLKGFDILVTEAKLEAFYAMTRFPQPNYVISKIAEEAGEVVKAAIHCAEKRETAENVAGEMKQLIAMLIRLWVEGDQVHGLPPIATCKGDAMTDPTRASITQEALAVADREAAMWMRSVTGRRRAVPQHEVPNMVRSIIVAYLTHVALHGVKP